MRPLQDGWYIPLDDGDFIPFQTREGMVEWVLDHLDSPAKTSEFNEWLEDDADAKIGDICEAWLEEYYDLQKTED